ncbi:methionyl-tRNA formyltransferase [Phototrophicus methaneseepsis]|uniref:Methionyl-tRNA formyltransferase n=1 Tax=Phototrophicus methaneseepsis TaxID=2710758 RepID=A0A7S8IE79_9CHLR|nr:methionyl-tRNA formyltransferase [Phototrophicus methaneseepsis]QPC81553.1 methionyl-tRNA formyltransferase [Phototrophicus methaneseepsis]
MARIIFMGTPDFAVPTLQALIQQHDVIGVVTQPDRPAGRRGDLRPPPVKVVAQEAGIPVYQPERLRKKAAIEALKQMGIPDLYVVAAFGQILPQAVLDIPAHGCINVHGSLLPRWRGAAPLQAALLAGDEETGITIMLMDAGLDTGPMLSKRPIPITEVETGESLHDKMAALGAELLIDTIPGYLDGSIQPQPQDDSLSTYAPQISRDDGRINWNDTALEIERRVRAFTPWPGTFTYWDDKQLKVHSGLVIDGTAQIGQVVATGDTIAVGTGEGLFALGDIQIAGKKRIPVIDFVNGYADFVGSVLDQHSD